MKKAVLSLAVVTAFAAPLANASELDTCIDAVKAMQKGEINKLEALNVKGDTVYEFEVIDESGLETEFMCDSKTSKIIETETEVDSADAQAFAEKAKISEKDAIAIATKAHPGEVKELEYEIESNGESTFEIDILGADNVETKIEVNAITGEIIEVYTEKWEIGIEEEENR